MAWRRRGCSKRSSRELGPRAGTRAPANTADPQAEEERELVRSVTADRRRALRRASIAGLGFVVLAGVGIVYDEPLRAFRAGEIDHDGNPRYDPPHPVDRHTLERIDFERVHETLLPRWTMALGGATTELGRRAADRRFDALAEEVAPDPNLSALLRSTHRAVREDPIANARRIDYLLWAYNHYLDANDVPYRLEASMAIGPERAYLRTLSYGVMADARTEEGHRLRLLRRVDHMNTVEGWLGHTRTGEEGALILTGRVLHFTVRHVWPALHPALDGRRPEAERSWLGYVRDEVRAALDDETYALLAETAGDQQTLIEVAAEVHARRACGSRFRILELPYNGLSVQSLMAIHRALERGEVQAAVSGAVSSDGADCPDITLDEAARIVGASERLGSTAGLEDAVERLAMVVTRAVAAHELQHVEDGDEPPCPGCPEELVGIARAEVSAYLSAFSTEGLGYLSLLQACAAPRGRGVPGRALQAVLDELLPYGCEGPTLHGLYAYAEEIEVHLFGKRGDIELPSLPRRVALLPRSEGHRSLPNWQALESGWGVALSGDQRAASRDQSALTP
jgi:hypothetical protein